MQRTVICFRFPRMPRAADEHLQGPDLALLGRSEPVIGGSAQDTGELSARWAPGQ